MYVWKVIGEADNMNERERDENRGSDGRVRFQRRMNSAIYLYGLHYDIQDYNHKRRFARLTPKSLVRHNAVKDRSIRE